MSSKSRGGPMPNKGAPLSSNKKVDTKILKNPDGTIVKTITTTYTDKFADGSTRTRTEVETLREIRTRVEIPWSTKELKVPKQALETNLETPLDDPFVRGCLQSHNELRARHNSPPMVLDLEMSRVAQAWANKHAEMNKNSQGKMKHSDWGYGENIYWKTGHCTDGRIPSEAWYSEINDYDWSKIDNQKGCGHFTQLIWKDSNKLGVAKAYSKKGDTYVVTTYSPPGNIHGKFPLNIEKPLPGIPGPTRSVVHHAPSHGHKSNQSKPKNQPKTSIGSGSRPRTSQNLQTIQQNTSKVKSKKSLNK